MPGCVIIGGGVVGLSLAYELARRRWQVRLLDRGRLGREASWAGAGILPPANAVTALHPLERIFFYLPLEHAESLEAQETAVASLDRLAGEAPEHLRGYCEYCAGFARGHRDIIAKFGRFPHRNAVLGRESTAAEIEWLAAEGARFGQ